MSALAFVPDKSLSIAHGPPLDDEAGLGALTLPGWLAQVTEKYNAREALVQHTRSGVERWSYGELWRRSVQVAQALIASKLDKGARVGILMTNRVEFVAAFLGVALAGGVATPLSTFSTPSELDQLLSASCCSLLIVEPVVLTKNFLTILGELEPALAASPPGELASCKYPYLRHVIALDMEVTASGVEPWADFLARGEGVSRDQVRARAAGVAPADPAVLFFSSGSTGKPKGVVSAQRAAAIQFWRWPRIFGLQSDVRCWVANGFFWSAPCSMGIGGALSAGGALVLQPTFQAEEALALMAAERVNCPMGWPHQWAQLRAAANWNEVDLSAMRYVAENNPIREHFTVNADWPEPTRIYGSSETFTLSSGYSSGTPENLLRGAHGFPLPGMTIKIIEPFTGATMPIGQRGEIAVKGATLMLGYVGVPLDETLDEAGFFRTGDGGYLDQDGRVFWEGRLNDIIKSGGANISPVEIDGVLLQCPGVKLVQTIGVPDDLLGEIVVSCVVRHQTASLDEDEVRAFAKRSLASYKIPRRILFLDESEFNKTASAKVKTADLRAVAVARLSARDSHV